MTDLLRSIVARASSIHERLAPDFLPVVEVSDEALINRRVNAWIQAAANGDPALFRRRLAWDGLDENRARLAVAPVHLHPEAALPQWAMILGEILEMAGVDQGPERAIDAQTPIAFEEVLIPFVTWARSTCARTAGESYECFPEIAHAALERQLLQSLSGHAAQSLLLEFSVEISMSRLDLLGSSAYDIYRTFVRRMRSGDLRSFFLEYSALGRTLSKTVELWVDATAELLRRFDADSRVIRTFLNIADSTGDELKVTGLATSLSGTHNGRSVTLITFASHSRVVYKPRSLAIEAGWNAFIEWLSELGAPVDFRSFRVLHCGGYGWAQYVDFAKCRNDAEARAYFTRAGALLCMVHLLGGMDCHGENVIAAGPHPVLVDLETLLSPQVRELEIGAESRRLARKVLMDSVLRTYLLPVYLRALHDELVFDESGFGSDAAENRPARADGSALRVYDYEGDFVGGFEAMYRFFKRERETMLQEGSPFQNLRSMEVRFAHRGPAQYSAVLQALRHPDLCRDGVERSLQIERLALAWLTSASIDQHPDCLQLWNAERECIERGDVPQFKVVARKGHEWASDRLCHFGETDLAFQVDLIRSSLRARAPAHALSEDIVTEPPALGGDGPWLAEAVGIARWLERTAICGSDGSASWLQPVWPREFMLANAKRELDIAGHDLYDGAAGIGLFLAAIERLTESGFTQLALAAVRPILIELEERGDETAEHLGIGGLSGLGSVVYGLSQMSRLLDAAELLHGAELAASLITDRRIDSDESLDVTDGSAGALLGLLSLYEINSSDTTLTTAMRCGRQLLAHLERHSGRLAYGFAQGRAGIAYALCRLHGYTGDPHLLSAARVLIEMNLRNTSVDHGSTATWCRGAAGIMFGRLASLAVIDDRTTRNEIDRTLAMVEGHEGKVADHLCCGACGMVDALATAARLLGRHELLKRATSLAWRTIWRSRERGEYRLGLPSAGQLRSPGLFLGVSGIGYTLLRLARPAVLPDVLLLR